MWGSSLHALKVWQGAQITLRYSVTSFSGLLLSRVSLRNSRPLRPVGKSGSRKTCCWWRRIRLGDTEWIGCTQIIGVLIACTYECWWSRPVSLWGHSLLPLKGHGNRESFVGTGKLKNVTFVFKKSKVEAMGSYRLVSITSVLGKVVEQIVLETIFKHLVDKKGVVRMSLRRGNNAWPTLIACTVRW